MPHICHTCQLLHVQISDISVSIYTSYELTAINNVTKSTAIHNFILLAYATEQICLLHCTYMSHCTNTVSHVTAHISLKDNKLHHVIAMLLLYMCQQQICPSNVTYMSHMPITSCVDIRQICQYMYLI